jgi:ATP-dependent Clp protease ATP-binding subunit ClpA
VSRLNRELQMTIQAAAREAQSRRHAYLTVEHLLYALAHDVRGAEILRSCGVSVARLKAEIEKFFEEDLEKNEDRESPLQLRQTLAFHRVLESAIAHASSAEKEEVEAGDLLAAIFQEPDSQAVGLLRAQGVSRLDVLRFVSHGITKDPAPEDGEAAPLGGAGVVAGEEGEGAPADPLASFTQNLTERAREGKLDPLVGRATEIERAIHVLARRRKNNPLFVGESGVGKTALAEGLAQAIVARGVPRRCARRRSLPWTSARCWPERATGATSRRASKPSWPRCASASSRSSSSTRSTPSSAPAPPRARRWTPRTC